ncbi:chaperonin 10-like protein [Collybia nuda]|uniref:L-arabinitol 4-dehydrogenase n=1 Tax=Collybia nuda TaxID=64659 RepID=A0A9P5Y947_9AGAR|nr:chaperonin 10-like protein [Collybia nuda]
MAPEKNNAVFTNKNHDLYVQEEDYPECGDDNCIVRIRATGICGSDIKFWKSGHVGSIIVEDPLGMGHESAGEIVEIGKRVTKFKVGDRVAIETTIPCGACKHCLGGRYNLCAKTTSIGAPGTPGTLRKYISHHAAWLHLMPPTMSFHTGALLEPLSVALAGIRRADLRLGQPVMVAGTGAVGLLAVALASAAGAYPIVGTDINESRLEVAKKLGATYTINVSNKTPEQVAKEVVEKTGEADRPEVAIECSGFESSIRSAVLALDSGGVMLQIGVCGNENISYPFGAVMDREIDLRYLFRYKSTWPAAIRLASSGKLNDLEKHMISHVFSLEECMKAFETVLNPNGNSIKVIVR